MKGPHAGAEILGNIFVRVSGRVYCHVVVDLCRCTEVQVYSVYEPPSNPIGSSNQVKASSIPCAEVAACFLHRGR
jgi:hypothetical protein